MKNILTDKTKKTLFYIAGAFVAVWIALKALTYILDAFSSLRGAGKSKQSQENDPKQNGLVDMQYIGKVADLLRVVYDQAAYVWDNHTERCKAVEAIVVMSSDEINALRSDLLARHSIDLKELVEMFKSDGCFWSLGGNLEAAKRKVA